MTNIKWLLWYFCLFVFLFQVSVPSSSSVLSLLLEDGPEHLKLQTIKYSD